MLVISDMSNRAEKRLAKSLKALELSKKLSKVMATPNRLKTSKLEAPVWLEPSLASLGAIIVGKSHSSAL